MEYGIFRDIIEWSLSAARQEALMAKHEGREVDSRGGMGLWQSFQAKFPKDRFASEDQYDEAIYLYSTVYARGAAEMAKAIEGTW